MREIVLLIDNYFKYVNSKEDYQKKYSDSFETIIKNIKDLLVNLSLSDLIELYLRYVKDLSVFKNDNQDFIFNLLYEAIISKLSTVSLMKVFDLYANIFVNSTDLEEHIESNQNIINARNYNLQDEYYIERQITKKSTTKEAFLKEYMLELESYVKHEKVLERAFSNLDKLQNGILIYVETKLKSLTEEEKMQLLETLNSRIEANSKEIVKRKNLGNNRLKLDLQSRFEDISIYELIDSLNITSLRNKNYVYESFRSAIMEQIKENKK